MGKVFKLLLHSIYPSLISYFIYVFATAFVKSLELRNIRDITGTVSVAFFLLFLIGAIGYLSLAVIKRDQFDK